MGFRTRPLVKAEYRPDSAQLALYGDVGSTAGLAVYRDPALADSPLTKPTDNFGLPPLTEALMDALRDVHGLDYSTLDRLAHASDFMSAVPGLKTRVMAWAGSLTGDLRKEVPGMFCSELVCHALEAVGYPPLRDGTRPAYVSPNLLADPQRSRLREVSGLMQTPDDSLPAETGPHAELPVAVAARLIESNAVMTAVQRMRRTVGTLQQQVDAMARRRGP